MDHAMVEPADPQAQTEALPLGIGDREPGDSRGAEAPELVAGRYEILGLLGSGGMGTVYRARDRELDETVALKVLKKELAASEGMLERFRREVKLARRVTHRNVARTFDIGEHGGERFLTMEFVEGEMLGSRLSRQRRLPITEVLAIARDLCAGLAAAHAAAVLHRDLKPENVILAKDGRAVITDFGIARAVSEGELGKTVGGIVGTPAYMAPEQVEGHPELDARADLYALGAILYELSTGEMAWRGGTVVAIAAARLLRPPPDPRLRVPGLAAGFAELVLRLMARSREDRFATAEETAAEIARVEALLTTGGATAPLASRAPQRRDVQKTVAVLPLVNLGPGDDAYLSQALMEDIVDLLSVVPELRVRPRGLTLGYVDPARDVREAGRALGVDVVVDGSIRRYGDVVRVAVRLVTVEDGFQLWAKRFDRPIAQVLSIADDAACAIASALTAGPVAQPRAAVTDPVAQDLYLRGRYLLHRGWSQEHDRPEDHLERAHELAPGDARIAGTYAHALAKAYGNRSLGAAVERRAREVAARALELDPLQPEAHAALGSLHVFLGEGAAAMRVLRRALTVQPNNVEALDLAGRLLTEVGRVDEGLRLLTRGIENEPELTHARYTIARSHALGGDFEASDLAFGPVPTNPADRVLYFTMRARMTLWTGDPQRAEALHALSKRADLGAMAEAVEGMLSIVSSRELKPGDRVTISRMLPLDATRTPRMIAFNAQVRAELTAAAGDLDEALACVQAADANGLFDLAWLEGCPLLAPLRERGDLNDIRERTSMRAARVAEAWDVAAP
jgi:eukaryotic-like serine/threonine-protein kinase